MGHRVADELFDLGPALRRDDVGPHPPAPLLVAVERKLFAHEREVANDSLAVEYEGDVRRRRDQLGGGFSVESAQRTLRGFELS